MKEINDDQLREIFADKEKADKLKGIYDDFIHGIFSTKDENNLEICFGLKFGNWIFSVLFVHRGRLPSYIDNAYDVLSSPISKLFL